MVVPHHQDIAILQHLAQPSKPKTVVNSNPQPTTRTIKMALPKTPPMPKVAGKQALGTVPAPPHTPVDTPADTPPQPVQQEEAFQAGDPAAILPTPTQAPTQEPTPTQSSTVKIAVARQFKIFVPSIGRCIMPGETVEVISDRWVRRQLELGTFTHMGE